MALIGRIRKNFWFVLLLLGLALAAFVIMDVTSPAGTSGAGGQPSLGSVNGTDIQYKDFQTAESVYYGNAGGDVFQKRNTIWNYFIEKSILDNEATQIGLNVSKDELMDLQFGANMSPIMRANWTNQQTGQIDLNQLNQFKTQIENGQAVDPRFRQFWHEQEKQVVKASLQDKLNNLVSKSIYTPSWMAETEYSEQNGSVDFAYVKVPFDVVPDSDITLEDADYQNYISSNKHLYTNDEETRTIEYIEFDVEPTAEDENNLRTKIADIGNNFVKAENDSLFAVGKKGYYNNFYFDTEQLKSLSDSVSTKVPGMAIGTVNGPFREANSWRIVKLLDKRVVADSVSARHILIGATQGNAASILAAKTRLDSIKTEIERGRANFTDMVEQFSTDATTKEKGGDLGYFTQGSMVPEFNAACFYEGKRGDLFVVTTQFGAHLLEIRNQKFLNRLPKYKISIIDEPIVPSKETQDRIYEEVAELIGSHPYLDDMVNVIGERDDVSVDRLSNIKKNDFIFGDLGSGSASRDIIRWAFDPGTSANEVAGNLFTYTDEVNYFNSKYVIAGLKSIEKSGLRTMAGLKDEITSMVRNEKKGASIASQFSGMNLNKLANKYDVSVDTINSVAFNSRFLQNIGNEPKVIAQAFGTAQNQLSEAVIGSSGVFMLKPLNKNQAGAATNLPSFRQQNAAVVRNQVGTKLIEALKDGAKVSDNRFTFF